ncbi:anti-anti-sigma factor [Gillisia mitskevichiae]|uniref:Anti-anti-sigma factor n=1 Tax=Gillisia mitskevichiae TaxID=270921 RepID=A0A495PVB0_9FLAO|nr:STAS domain-containing protein [Gillisia mitskevichiae]RKS53936.1 anti-anti-sigma factor [Gillisia mitskevichiae]
MFHTLPDQEEFIVELKGQITYANSFEIQLDLEMVLYHFETLILDLSDLKYLDKAGVKLLSGLKQKARLNGKEVIIFSDQEEVLLLNIRNPSE